MTHHGTDKSLASAALVPQSIKAPIRFQSAAAKAKAVTLLKAQANRLRDLVRAARSGKASLAPFLRPPFERGQVGKLEFSPNVFQIVNRGSMLAELRFDPEGTIFPERQLCWLDGLNTSELSDGDRVIFGDANLLFIYLGGRRYQGNLGPRTVPWFRTITTAELKQVEATLFPKQSR